jgi:hypothetical protein
MVGGRACAIHRKTLIIAPPGFETVAQRRINTGAYGNLTKNECNLKGRCEETNEHFCTVDY